MSETICHKFVGSKSRPSKKPAIIAARNRLWFEVTWSEYYENAENLACGLSNLGIGPGDSVAIFSNTRFEWAVSDMAIMGLGAITVPIYQSSTAEEVKFILNNSEAKAIICETEALAEVYRKVADDCPTTKHLFVIDIKDPKGDEDSLENLMADGEDKAESEPKFFEDQCRQRKIDDIATIIYTSGTTGQPKGVVLTHKQIMSEVTDAFPLLGMSAKDRTLAFLPFAHILGRIEIWGHILIGYEMCYAESIERIKFNIQSQQPTVIIAVPRIFEKIYNGILGQIEINPAKKKVFEWALGIGKQVSKSRENKKSIPLHIAVQYRLAKKLVFNKIKEKMGGRLRFAMSGGAPLNKELAEFFSSIGILLLEGYGLTETTAAVCVNTTFDYKFGSVGKPIGDVRIKLDHDGEILVKSDKVMREYYKNESATKEVFTEDGYFRTGDIGVVDSDGYVIITDRKKDLIKTAGGKYVAPQKLEGLLKLNRFISQVHIHGDKRKYIVALLTLNEEAIRDYSKTENTNVSLNEAHESPEIKEIVRKSVAEVNAKLASFESIKNFAILPGDFSIETGELTPSLKVKRKVVDQRYAEVIDGLYGLDRTSI